MLRKLCQLDGQQPGCSAGTSRGSTPVPAASASHPRSSRTNHPPRYLIILYSNSTRHKQKLSLKDQEAELRGMQERHGVDGEQHGKPKK